MRSSLARSRQSRCRAETRRRSKAVTAKYMGIVHRRFCIIRAVLRRLGRLRGGRLGHGTLTHVWVLDLPTKPVQTYGGSAACLPLRMCRQDALFNLFYGVLRRIDMDLAAKKLLRERHVL